MTHFKYLLHKYKSIIELAFVMFCIYLSSFHSYLLFHSLSEMLSVVILVMVFIVTWHARKLLDNSYFLVIGISFLFIGFITFIHSIAYKGMGIFVSGGANLPTQLWIASRYYLGLVFLIAPFFIDKKIKPRFIFAANVSVFLLLLLSIFYWQIFPTAYIEDAGLTLFKIVSEYVVVLLFFAAMVILYKKRRYFDREVYKYIQIALSVMALTDLVFTLYVGVYSSLNMFGHILGVLSYYIIYFIIVRKALVDPHTILYKKLQDNQAALQESEHKYRSLVDLSPDSIIVHDSGLITYVNISTKKMFGHDGESGYIGKSILDFVHPDYVDVIKKRMASIYNNQRDTLSPIEVKLLKSDHSTFVAEIQSSKIYIDGKVSIQTIVNDVSEKKELERTKTEFVALASHQLKTPLASMMLAIDLLYREAAGPVNNTLREYLDDLHESITGMNDTIKSLLNVSKLELGTLVFQKERIDIASCINSIMNDVKLLVQKKNINLKVCFDADLPVVYFDKNAIKLILENVFSNAIRYNSEGGNISITARRQSEKILISVADSGCGIPEKDKNDIFNKSFRADNAKKLSDAGSGLGLYMVKSIAEKVGAKIWFESEENVGTTFYVLI